MEIHSERSLARIDRGDLLRLAEIAAEVEARLFARHPQGAGRYAGRLICRALCQGAALHYLNARNGVKDFDVWSFYAARDDGPFPYRWRGTADYGPSKFGRYPDDPPRFAGRRVDLLGRSLDVPLGAGPTAVLRDYLSAARTESAMRLAEKAVVLISPEQSAGQVIWPRDSSLRLQYATAVSVRSERSWFGLRAGSFQTGRSMGAIRGMPIACVAAAR